MEEKEAKVEVGGYITREKMCDWAIATCDVMEEDGLDEVSIWNVEIDIWAGL